MTDAISRLWTELSVLDAVAKLLIEVAPLKVTGPVFLETSLAEDLDFDSLDAIDMVAAVNEYFSIALDFEAWIDVESQRSGNAFTIGSLCRSIMSAIGRE